MKNPLSVAGFLQVGGVVLILVAILSYLPFTNNPDTSIFGSAWWFDGGEGIAHLVLGIVAIAAAYVVPANLQRPLVIVVGVVALLFALYGLILPPGSPTALNTFGLGNLESPLDTILHLVVAVWALYAAFAGERSLARA